MRHLYIIIILMMMTACDNSCKKTETPAFYEPDRVEIEQSEEQQDLSDVDTPSLSSDEVISVPFNERNGVKFVEVKLNNSIGVDMILDSGCSGATISISEAEYLYNKGVLTDDDLVGAQNSTYADGRMELNQVVNLRELSIGGKITCQNVKATIIENPQVPLLLGNDVLNRVSSYEVDNQDQVIKFRIK